MTAEIAILNKMGVALAADSKVTIRHGGQEKTYDTVNKLFTLSRCHPVGVMVYGNADFMDFPWETIIKTYRKQKNTTAEESIRAWSADFLNFLKDFYPFESADYKKYILKLLESFWDEILDSVRPLLNFGPSELSAEDLLLNYVQDEIAILKNEELFLDSEALQKFTGEYKWAFEEFFSDKPFSNQKTKKLLKKYLELCLTRHKYSKLASGIVVAGFGENERLPAIIAYDLDGFVGANLKHRELVSFNITRESGGAVMPFAQHEMVDRFMEGIDPGYASYLDGSIGNLMQEIASAILEHYSDPSLDTDALKAEVTENVKKNVLKFSERNTKYRSDNFSSPITAMVTTLPKEELANMAEALVNLTSLKRRISNDRETVGGPIDVAVISKGDGFIWVKRKHYFDAKLNHHFSANYFKDFSEGSEN